MILEAGTQTTEEQDGISEVIVKSLIEFKPGFEERTAIFESFKELPVKTGFSWGSESGTMSFKWKSDAEPNEAVEERVTDFLHSIDIDYPGVIHMLGVFEGEQEQIQVVDSTDLDEGADETVTKANFVYTMDPNIAVVIRPADCPISVVYAKNKFGQDIAGFIHSSGVSANAGIPRLAIRHLIEQEDVDPTTIRIGITPGISKENYSISDEVTIERTTHPIIERNWKSHIDPKTSDLGEERRHIDILRATIIQYIEAGISPMQISAYDVDTFEAHRKGVGFSHRLYEASLGADKPVTPGRYMVAVQLLE